MPNLLEKLQPVLRDRVVMSWVLTALMVAAAFLIRLLMQPGLGSGLSYSLFYPVVILAAYAYGRDQAIAASVVSAALAFFCFVEPAYAWKISPSIFAALGSFTIVCAVAIVVITGLTGALKNVSRELGRAQAVADSHASLFHELNERMTHHMRLVAGVLALQAKGEPEPQVADSLKRAMERTLLISRVHRELGGRVDESVDFDAFAAALARAVCVARDQPPERAVVEPSGLTLGAEEATSLGVALAECLGALFDTGVTDPLRVRFNAHARHVEVAISEAGEEAEGALVSVTNGYLLRAMTEQLGAAVALRADAQGSALVLSIPRAVGGGPPSPVSTLH